MKTMDLEVRPVQKGENHGRLFTVILDGQDVSWQIRTSEVDAAVPTVASYPRVRAHLVHQQRDIAKGKDVVMEGRDITYKVLPEADLKIYLTANEVVRARRHHAELQKIGEQIDFDQVLQALLRRDSQDMSRKTDPLKVVPEAWVVDSSDLSIQEVIAMIVAKVRKIQTQQRADQAQAATAK